MINSLMDTRLKEKVTIKSLDTPKNGSKYPGLLDGIAKQMTEDECICMIYTAPNIDARKGQRPEDVVEHCKL